jgi:hypothetical protein
MAHIGPRVAASNPDRLSRESLSRIHTMNKLLGVIGATAGGYVGWAIGARIGMMTAFMLSMVGTGVGIYVARRVAQYLIA